MVYGHSTFHVDLSDTVCISGDDFNGRPAPPTNEETPGASNTSNTQVGQSKTAQKILASQKQPPIPCLFLGNLGFEATDQKIRDMIEGHAIALAQKKLLKKKPKEKDADLLGLEEEDDMQSAETDTGIKKVRMGTFEDSGLCKG